MLYRTPALIVAVVGLALAAKAYSAWSEVQAYTVAAHGVVSHRTPTSTIFLLEEEIPGGRRRTEITYGLASGGGADALPPADGPKFNLGDRVALVYPPGKPNEARLEDTMVPAVPPLWGWAGLGLFFIGGAAFLQAGKSRRRLS